MLRWVCAGVVAGVLTSFALLLLTARYPSAGPVVLYLTETHGIHRGDLGVVAAWILAVLALLGLVSRSGSRPSPPPRADRCGPDLTTGPDPSV